MKKTAIAKVVLGLLGEPPKTHNEIDVEFYLKTEGGIVNLVFIVPPRDQSYRDSPLCSNQGFCRSSKYILDAMEYPGYSMTALLH